jgi:hypothetical protein
MVFWNCVMWTNYVLKWCELFLWLISFQSIFKWNLPINLFVSGLHILVEWIEPKTYCDTHFDIYVQTIHKVMSLFIFFHILKWCLFQVQLIPWFQNILNGIRWLTHLYMVCINWWCKSNLKHTLKFMCNN